jgi:hypothetical protein
LPPFAVKSSQLSCEIVDLSPSSRAIKRPTY